MRCSNPLSGQNSGLGFGEYSIRTFCVDKGEKNFVGEGKTKIGNVHNIRRFSDEVLVLQVILVNKRCKCRKVCLFLQ